MNFEATAVSGLMVVSAEAHEDDRGLFVRAFCEEESVGAGAPFQVRQANLSQNRKRGTLRGLHYQDEPRPDPKMVRCVRGAVWDVAVDLRSSSPSFLKWFGCDAEAVNARRTVIRESIHVPVKPRQPPETTEQLVRFPELAVVRHVDEQAAGPAGSQLNRSGRVGRVMGTHDDRRVRNGRSHERHVELEGLSGGERVGPGLGGDH